MAEAETPKPIWLQLFLQVGFPTAMAILLLAALLGWMPSPLMNRLDAISYQLQQAAYISRVNCYLLTRNQNEKAWCEPWEKQR